LRATRHTGACFSENIKGFSEQMSGAFGPPEAAMSDRRDGQNPALKVTALSAEDLAILLSKSGGRTVTTEVLRSHVVAGAPTNADGTLNLVHYAAWLVRELCGRGD
jgi:hypothetical protein